MSFSTRRLSKGSQEQSRLSSCPQKISFPAAKCLIHIFFSGGSLILLENALQTVRIIRDTNIRTSDELSGYGFSWNYV